MFKNKKFKKYALPVVLFSFIYFYFYAGLQNDHLNVVTPYLQNTYGWTAGRITLPVTVGGIIAIFMFMIAANAFMKIGIRNYTTIMTVFIICSILGLACSNGNYGVYFVSLMVLRATVGIWQLAGMNLCTNWFAKYRGRAIGIIACGPPLFSATGTAILTFGVESRLGFQGTYLCVGGVIVICAVLYFLLIRDNPEDVGFFPDGADSAVSASGGKTLTISLKELLSYKETYLITVILCVANFIAICYMAFYVTNLQMLGVAQAVYLPALTIGALIAFPVGYIGGMINDSVGPNIAYMVIFATGLIAPVVYLLTDCNSLLLCTLIAFSGGACGGGGGALIAPILTHFFGRARYNSVNRWLFSFFAFTNALAASFMSVFLERNAIRTAFVVLASLLLLAIASAVVLQVAGKVRYDD